MLSTIMLSSEAVSFAIFEPNSTFFIEFSINSVVSLAASALLN